MRDTRISGQKDTQAAADPMSTTSGSQCMSARICVRIESHASGWA